MFKGTETVTILNRRHDRATDTDTVTATVIQGVSWYEADGSTGQDTKSNARVIKVRIPAAACTRYVTPDSFRNSMGGWTLQKGDKIFRGITQQDTPSGAGVMTIREIHDNRNHPLGHIYVEGD